MVRSSPPPHQLSAFSVQEDKIRIRRRNGLADGTFHKLLLLRQNANVTV